MNQHGRDHSTAHEPAFRGPAEPGEPAAREPALGGPRAAETPEDRALHNVWDEPVTQAPPSAEAYTYAAWYGEGMARTTVIGSWAVVAGLCAVSGLFALAGSLTATPSPGVWGVLTFVVFGPTVEEMLKIGLPLMVLERRPYVIRGAAQLLILVLMGALVFAVVENGMYLYGAEEPSSGLKAWRWGACTSAHLVASGIAGLGLLRIFHHSRRHMCRPRVARGYGYFIAAIVVHGCFNAMALLLAAGTGIVDF